MREPGRTRRALCTRSRANSLQPESASPARRRSRLPDSQFFQDGVHPTAAGHAVFGEAIAEFLVRSGLLGDAPEPETELPQ